MPVIRDEPIATDFLSVSQPKLKTNTNDFDDAIGVDHVAASSASGNAGKHTIIQHVEEASIPSTTDDLKTFTYEPLSALGPLLYNRKENDAIPTPLSCLQSGSAAITIAPSGTSNILDFSGMPYCYGLVFITADFSSATRFPLYNFFWDGSAGYTSLITPSVVNLIIAEFSTSTLRLRNPVGSSTYSNLAWTVEFKRIHTPT